MRIAYSLAVQSSDKNRSRNAMNTWLRFVRVRRLQRMQQAKERLATTMLQQTNRGRLAVAYRSLRMFHEEVKKRRARQQAAYNLIGRGASTQVQRVALNTWLKFAAERRAMRFRLQVAQALLAASRYAKWRLDPACDLPRQVAFRKLMEADAPEGPACASRRSTRTGRNAMIFRCAPAPADAAGQGAPGWTFRRTVLKLFADDAGREARRQKDASTWCSASPGTG